MATQQTREGSREKDRSLFFLFSASLALAGAISNPAEYTVNIHVSRSRMVSRSTERASNGWTSIIDGKKYELESEYNG